MIRRGQLNDLLVELEHEHSGVIGPHGGTEYRLQDISTTQVDSWGVLVHRMFSMTKYQISPTVS